MFCQCSHQAEQCVRGCLLPCDWFTQRLRSTFRQHICNGRVADPSTKVNIKTTLRKGKTIQGIGDSLRRLKGNHVWIFPSQAAAVVSCKVRGLGSTGPELTGVDTMEFYKSTCLQIPEAKLYPKSHKAGHTHTHTHTHSHKHRHTHSHTHTQSHTRTQTHTQPQ